MAVRSNVPAVVRRTLKAALTDSDLFKYSLFSLRRGTDFMVLSWWGQPPAPAVRDICKTVSPDVGVVFEHVRVWSCGEPHRDKLDAWAYHNIRFANLSELHDQDAVTVEALELVFHDELDLIVQAEAEASWFATCDCGSSGTEGVSFEVLTELAAQLPNPVDCSPGEFQSCTTCYASGQSFDRLTRRYQVCPTCKGERVLDLSDPLHAAAYAKLLE